MDLPMNEKSQRLLDTLMTIPPAFSAAEKLLKQESFSGEEVTKTAIRYAEECTFEYEDYFLKTCPRCDLRNADIPHSNTAELHSAYLCDVVEMMLRYGLNPNAVYEHKGDFHNIMATVEFVDYVYAAADTLKLLLESGGDPNLKVNLDSVFESLDDDIWFGSVEQELRWRYDAWVHTWMVLLAYGCENSGIQVFREYDSDALFDLKKLRDHRNYYYGLSYENGDCVIHIYDKKTFWEVARS